MILLNSESLASSLGASEMAPAADYRFLDIISGQPGQVVSGGAAPGG